MTKTLIVLSVLALSTAAAADPRADKLFAAAKALRATAQKDFDEAHKLRVEAATKEAAGRSANAQASRDDAAALGILKADAKRVQANKLRNEAHAFQAEAAIARHLASLHHHAADTDTHEAAEDAKAAKALADQPALAKTVADAGAAKLAAAAVQNAAAKAAEAKAAADDAKAKALLAEAAKLDPAVVIIPRIAHPYVAVHPK